MAYLATHAKPCNMIGMAAQRGYIDLEHEVFKRLREWLVDLFVT